MCRQDAAKSLHIHRYEKYTVEDEKKDKEKSNDRFMDAYTEMVDRVNELNLVNKIPLPHSNCYADELCRLVDGMPKEYIKTL